jgi:hypothetical protein
MTPIVYVVRLFLYLYSRQAFLTEVVSFYKQPIRGSVSFVSANRSKALTNIQAPGELQLSVGLLFAHQQIPLGVPRHSMECAEHTPTFFAWYQYYADSE